MVQQPARTRQGRSGGGAGHCGSAGPVDRRDQFGSVDHWRGRSCHHGHWRCVGPHPSDHPDDHRCDRPVGRGLEIQLYEHSGQREVLCEHYQGLMECPVGLPARRHHRGAWIPKIGMGHVRGAGSIQLPDDQQLCKNDLGWLPLIPEKRVAGRLDCRRVVFCWESCGHCWQS